MSSLRPVTPPVISLDQKLIVFDVEQPRNATQSITVTKVSSRRFVAFRVLANAPTRYLVNPNSGLLKANGSTKVQIQLVENRYNPQHRMIIEAVGFDDEKRWPGIWKDVKPEDQPETIHLELSTTVINIASAMRMPEENGQTKTLAQIMEMSHTRGEERVREMKDLVAMLTVDNETLRKNIENTENLKKVLAEQIASKEKQIEEAMGKIKLADAEMTKLTEEVAKQEQEVATQREKQAFEQQQAQSCTVM